MDFTSFAFTSSHAYAILYFLKSYFNGQLSVVRECTYLYILGNGELCHVAHNSSDSLLAAVGMWVYIIWMTSLDQMLQTGMSSLVFPFSPFPDIWTSLFFILYRLEKKKSSLNLIFKDRKSLYKSLLSGHCCYLSILFDLFSSNRYPEAFQLVMFYWFTKRRSLANQGAFSYSRGVAVIRIH